MTVVPGQKLRTLYRWIKFNTVGAIGICIHISALYVYVTVFKANSLLATVLAVETAILHNFVWHHFLTWGDRRFATGCDVFRRLLVFNATTGGVSIAGNLLFVSLMAEGAHMSLLAANLIAIAACSLINFVLSDKFVFRAAARTVIPT
jgi:putative flippase GtrA